MKLTCALLVAGCLVGIASERARADDDEPKVDTPKAKAGEAWMGGMLAPGGSVAAPSKDKPLDYVTANGTKSCRALKQGTAKDIKALMKLKTCVVDSYKAANHGDPIPGQWMELTDPNQAVSAFPAKYARKLKAQAKGSTIVEGHYSGDGLNFDVYLALDGDDNVHAIWLTEEAFE
ncbi:MAG TPA: hypothetical protein VHE35_19715 [Kofleriaceae bacterium]|nr:hypothetical protein [Kofleriaceae bacterium]